MSNNNEEQRKGEQEIQKNIQEELDIYDSELDTNKESILFRVIALLASSFHLYTGAFGMLSSMAQRAVHLLLFGMLALLGSKGNRPNPWFKAYTFIMLAIIVISGIYMITTWQDRVMGTYLINNFQIILGSLTIISILEITRRSIGSPLPVVAGLFIIYAFFGHYIPGIFGHGGYDIGRIIDTIYLGIGGVYGTALGASASFIVLFIMFGALLNKTGVGKLFIDMANVFAGRFRGGPAKVSVIASSGMGMISGSPIANVVTTGPLTIPLMKRTGFPPHVAGGIEAAASTGGTLTPPIMGVAAFIMADYLGVPYATIVGMAIIPAILYYIAMFVMVDLTSVKLGLKGLPKEEMPQFRSVFRGDIHLLLPIVVLICLLVMGFPTLTVVFYSIVALFVIAMLKKSTRLSFKDIVDVAEATAKNTIPVASATACAGIVVAVVGLTGLGVTVTNIITTIGNEMMFIALILAAIAAIILGMAMPVAPVYIILAALTAPALIQAGLAPESAHFFIFYFAAVATITPPVCLTSYAAAGIAGGDTVKTAWYAFKFGLMAFLIPFFIAYNPVLLAQGTIMEVGISFITAAIGVIALGFVLTGLTFNYSITWIEKLLFVGGALLLLYPETYTDLAGISIIVVLYLLGLKIHPTHKSLGTENSVQG